MSALRLGALEQVAPKIVKKKTGKIPLPVAGEHPRDPLPRTRGFSASITWLKVFKTFETELKTSSNKFAAMTRSSSNACLSSSTETTASHRKLFQGPAKG